MKKFIVITSIFEPTVAIKEFAKLDEFELIVVGDKKTPENWYVENVTFLSVTSQQQLGFKLGKVLPYNHYCRKMIGYLYAIKNNATYIIDTDDDNIPKSNWGFPPMKGKFECIQGNEGFVNIYQLFTSQKIWPRGLPLRMINNDFNLIQKIQQKDSIIGVWQGLADEEPDVDAIYRLTNNDSCFFENRVPIVLQKGTISPFNTQNTIILKDLFPLLYLPTYVTFRFTDILRSLVFQPIMWLYNYNLGFTNATVFQKRNPHDYFKDFISEIPMYQYTEKVVNLVSGVITQSCSISDNLYNSYNILLKNSIVSKKEMETLEAWIEDCQLLINGN